MSPRWGYDDVAPLGLSASFPSDEGSPKAGVGLSIGCRPDEAPVPREEPRGTHTYQPARLGFAR